MTSVVPGTTRDDGSASARIDRAWTAFADAVPASAIAAAAAAAAGLLVLTSTGTLLVVAVLVGVATADRRPVAVTGLAAVVVAVRFGTVDLGHLAGAQEVLGPAGLTGDPMAAAASWLSAGALVLVAWHHPPSLPGRAGLAIPAIVGVVAATVVWGPGPADLVGRIAATVVGAAVGAGGAAVIGRAGPVGVAGTTSRLHTWRPRVAVLAAVAGAVLAVAGT